MPKILELKAGDQISQPITGQCVEGYAVVVVAEAGDSLDDLLRTASEFQTQRRRERMGRLRRTRYGQENGLPGRNGNTIDLGDGYW